MASDAFQTRLKEAAEDLRANAAGRASWSARIPASLEITIDGYTATVRANPAVAPQARAYELDLRHPLNYPHQYGWGNTPNRPFLAPAAVATADEAAVTISDAVDDIAISVGFHKQ